IEEDQPLLADQNIRHCEEPIILLAAESKALVEEAARHINIEYDPLDAILTIEDALAARNLIHGSDNVMKRYVIERGDIASGLSQDDRIVEGQYRVPHQEQLYIETQGMIAIPEANGLTVMGSMQCPYYIHKALKSVFGLSDDQVVVIQTTTGGGFGGKE